MTFSTVELMELRTNYSNNLQIRDCMDVGLLFKMCEGLPFFRMGVTELNFNVLEGKIPSPNGVFYGENIFDIFFFFIFVL